MGWAVELVVGVVSTVVAVRGQQQAARQSQAMADYNYALQKQQADATSQLAQIQANQNAQSLEYQANVQQRNSEMLRQQAEAVQAQTQIATTAERKAGVQNVNNQREEARRYLALQMAKVGESGTTGAGTPLDSLATAASDLEYGAQLTWLKAETDARRVQSMGDAQAYQLREEGTNEGLKAGMTLFQAANAQWEGATAQVQKRLSLYGAEANKLEGYGTARGYRMAAYGTIFSGLAQSVGSAYSSYQVGGNSFGYRGGSSPYTAHANNFNNASDFTF